MRPLLAHEPRKAARAAMAAAVRDSYCADDDLDSAAECLVAAMRAVVLLVSADTTGRVQARAAEMMAAEAQKKARGAA